MDKKNSVLKNINDSKIYKSLNESLKVQVIDDCFQRYGEKDLEKRSKNLLHQIWGAYYSQKPNFQKILEKFDTENQSQSLDNILRLHSSTNERLSFYGEFYRRIFSITGKPKSIIDHACGLNPLSFLYMELPKDTSYKAFDIDNDEVDFLNQIFRSLNLSQFKAENQSIFEYNSEFAEVIFMFKFLPVIEQQQKGKSLEILEKQNCDFLVISFPSKSISGREKGMASFYSDNFENLIKEKDWKYDKLSFQNEIVFVINKKNGTRQKS